jgi:hypothetical protein
VDRALRQSFACTLPAPRLANGRPGPHPRPWEREVEAWIRRQTPPAGPGELLRRGEQDGSLVALGAAALAEQADEVCVVKLHALAICTAARGGSGELAELLVEQMLRRSSALSEALGGRI